MPAWRRGRRLAARGRYAGQAGVALVSQPVEGVERILERLAEWRDVRREPWSYDPVERCEAEAERQFGPPPAGSAESFDDVWEAAMMRLEERGLAVGRGVFGGWDDGDVRLCRLAWRLTRTVRPQFAVETGVARGLTTRVILEAMERNGTGRLWSIDLPPLIQRELEDETAAAVAPVLRDRWTLVPGSSRHRLPELLRQLPRVDLFVHDSMHTTRNVRFELATIWPALRPGGAVLVDDVERNRATAEFLAATPAADGVICPAEDGRALIGVIVKRAD
jgi:Methyltransferase domain